MSRVSFFPLWLKQSAGASTVLKVSPVPFGDSKGGASMTLAIPPELQRALTTRAAERQVTPEELVREALAWYLQIDADLLDELSAWQEIRDEAIELAAPQ
jgi:predicted transcriptional regulator